MVQDLNATLRLVRTAVFGVASLFAFIVLALSASITNYTTNINYVSSYYYSSSYYSGGYYFTFAALGIASAILTLFTLPPMLLLSLKRKGAATSMIGLEVGWIWFLWIMWLSVGGNSVGISLILLNCNLASGKSLSVCQQISALTAFAFLTWLLLFFYNITIFAFAIRQHMRGNTGIWRGYVTETDFVAAGPNSAYPKAGEAFAPQYGAPGVVAPGYPIQQQYPVQQQMPPPQQASPYPQA